jgi:hypothetical protein
MQVTILSIFKKDFTFGIMSKHAVKISRLEWSLNSSICWVGCIESIFPNQLKVGKFSQSDHVTVVVDTKAKYIRFYLNKSCVFERDVPEDIIN